MTVGRQLFEVYETFRQSILEMDQIHFNLTQVSIVRDIGFFGAERLKTSMPDIWPVSLIVPTIAMIQIALVDLLASLNIHPTAVVGHSAGETAMMYACGAVSKALAIEVAVRRAKAMTSVEDFDGGMAAISCPPGEAEDIVRIASRDHDPSEILEVACYNAPAAVAISGHNRLLQKAIELATHRGYWARKIKTLVAGHSSLLEDCRTDYLEGMTEAFIRHASGDNTPKIVAYSCQTGQRWDAPFTPEYVWASARAPVKFGEAISKILADNRDTPVFLEISPHPALSSYLAAIGVNEERILCPMHRIKKPSSSFDEPRHLLQTIGKLTLLGFNAIYFEVLNQINTLKTRTPLPPYPFLPHHVPIYPESSRLLAKQFRNYHGLLNYEFMVINASTHPDLAQHVINGESIFPATGFLEMVCVKLSQSRGQAE